MSHLRYRTVDLLEEHTYSLAPTAIWEPWPPRLHTPILPYQLPSVAVSQPSSPTDPSLQTPSILIHLFPFSYFPPVYSQIFSLLSFPDPFLLHVQPIPIFYFIFLISATMSRCLCSSHNSWSVLILNIPCSTTGTCILLNICWMGSCHFNNKRVQLSSKWQSKLQPAIVSRLSASKFLADLQEFLICTLLFSV